MGVPPLGVLAVVAAFRIVGVGHPLPSEVDNGPCPQGRWSQALYAAHSARRVGTMVGCGLSISKREAPLRITQRTRETFVLPGRTIRATCDERFVWSDLHRSRASFRCAVEGGGAIVGGGAAVDGRANYLLRIR